MKKVFIVLTVLVFTSSVAWATNHAPYTGFYDNPSGNVFYFTAGQSMPPSMTYIGSGSGGEGGAAQAKAKAQAQAKAQAKSKSSASASNELAVSFTDERELMNTPIVPAWSLPMVAGGVRDVSVTLGNLSGINMWNAKDKFTYIDSKKYIFNLGSWFGYSQIYYEDIEPTIFSMAKEDPNTYFRVTEFDGQYTAGVMLNTAGGQTGNDGLSSGVATAGVGAIQGGARPTYVIKMYKK